MAATPPSLGVPTEPPVELEPPAAVEPPVAAEPPTPVAGAPPVPVAGVPALPPVPAVVSLELLQPPKAANVSAKPAVKPIEKKCLYAIFVSCDQIRLDASEYARRGRARCPHPNNARA
jgi:hypothetical protein